MTRQDAHGMASHAASVDDKIDFRQFFSLLKQSKWKITVITAGTVLMGSLYAFSVTPVFHTHALLQVDNQQEGESEPTGQYEWSRMVFTGKKPTATEVEIIEARSSLEPIVGLLGLDIEARPRYMPVIGRLLAHHFDIGQIADQPYFNINKYAWGNQDIKVDMLQVPDAYKGKSLRLVAGEKGQYRLYGPDNKFLLRGQVGALVSSPSVAGLSKQAPAVQLKVTRLIASKGNEFTLVKLSNDDAVGALQNHLTAFERGKATGIVQLDYDDTDPERAAKSLNVLADSIVRQNISTRRADINLKLTFLESQLAPAKARLDAAENELNAFRTHTNTVDTAVELQNQSRELSDIERQILDAQIQLADLRHKYTDEHPAVIALNQKYQELLSQRDKLKGRIHRLPGDEQEMTRLQRKAKLASDTYVNLLSKANEFRLTQAGLAGMVRILDQAAVPVQPSSPNKKNIVAVSGVMGAMLAVFIVMLMARARNKIQSPLQIEQKLELPIYTVIPHSKAQAVLSGRFAGANGPRLLALLNSSDLALERLRSLRTSLHKILPQANNPVIAINSPSPGSGKSFISANLAYVLAASGKKVLLVDGDLRKGHLHTYLNVPPSPGLADVLDGRSDMQVAIQDTPVTNLSLLATGQLPRHPSELLMSENFNRLLHSAAGHFDVVVVDTPPLLTVTDGVIISQRAGINLLVIRAGHNSIEEVELTVKHLEQNGIALDGIIFNDLVRASGAPERLHLAYQEFA